MKKIVLSLAGVMAAATFAPEASAVPAFARQTGMACSACHQQHFPAINSFGRAFKSAGYTMVGTEEKIEDPKSDTSPGLSIPSTLNAAIVGYMQYSKTNGPSDGSPGAPGTSSINGKTTNNGSLQIPQQVSLFFGGRVGENIGFEAEYSISGAGTGQAASSLIRLKVPFVQNWDTVKTLEIPFSTSNGVADSFEILDTGAVNVHAFNQNAMAVISAAQYIGTATNANGVAFVANNDSFFTNLAKFGANTGTGKYGADSSTYARGAWMTGDLIPNYDFAVGGQYWGGTSVNDTLAGGPGGAAGMPVQTKAWAIDAQLLGQLGSLPLTFVASYANAPMGSNGMGNLYNNGGSTTTAIAAKHALTVGAELGVVPGIATVQAGFRFGKSGQDAGLLATGVANGANASDNAIMVGATYSIALNVRAEVTYVHQSGDIYSFNATNNPNLYGNNVYTIDLAMGF
ncbi:hypothetical protein [Sideroxydans sp. CL21]|uniref:hypothetical protein n=1 Tax=Sideroxydans sp. CL21 TaxID=2600596 RepID=UPI0024BD21D3|nr:hypothetical protein [Sideroxydans sp. CL21]